MGIGSTFEKKYGLPFEAMKTKNGALERRAMSEDAMGEAIAQINAERKTVTSTPLDEETVGLMKGLKQNYTQLDETGEMPQ